MAIRIIDNEPDVYVTREEHDRLSRALTHMVDKPSFEDYVRARAGNPPASISRDNFTGEQLQAAYNA